MLKCPQCGTSNKDGVNFCMKCGYNFKTGEYGKNAAPKQKNSFFGDLFKGKENEQLKQELETLRAQNIELQRKNGTARHLRY